MIVAALTFPLRLALHYWERQDPIDWAVKHPANVQIFAAESSEERAA